jgi:hypothetical protein
MESNASFAELRQNLCALCALCVLCGFAPAAEQGPSWQPPGPAAVRAQALAWLDQKKPDAATRKAAEAIWADVSDSSSGSELLSRLARTFALADPAARALVDLCSHSRPASRLPAAVFLRDPQTPPLAARNLRLLYGLWLARQLMFDEALEQLADLKPADVVDPASLLFYQAVSHHQLLHREAALGAIGQLLSGAPRAPRRYVDLASLMQQDLKGLKEDSLDHIGRRMDDVRRRLDLGRSGKKVLAIEDGIIASLDKLIRQAEERQRKQAAAAAGGMQPGRPAQDSRIMLGKGPGEVDKKKIGNQSGWGDIPPKQREEALQQIGREFPPHYRDLVEQYFRKMASEGSRD